MRQKVRVLERPRMDTASDQCQHFWRIEAANGPKSRGVCKYCGETKDFFNSFNAVEVSKKQGNPLDLPRMQHVDEEEDRRS